MTVKIFVGDCRSILRAMPAESVHCCITSPPYFGLRDYGIAPSIWGGDPACDHDWSGIKRGGGSGVQGTSSQRSDRANVEAQETHRSAGSFCSCGAWLGSFGLEPTYQLYLEHAVEIFREVKRVLRDDGTLWLNLGDSYANDGKWGGHTGGKHVKVLHASPIGRNKRYTGLKPKDLIGIPWRVAFALQDDGWWLRQDIIWCLSGGVWLYAKTPTKIGPMTLKDLVRLDPKTVELWNGERWTRVVAWTKRSGRSGAKEIILRSGERIGCTDNHIWPTSRGNVRTDKLRRGDVIKTARLPTGDRPAGWLTDEAFWLAGLFLAEGNFTSRRNRMALTGHVSETDRVDRIRELISHYGGSMRVYNPKGKVQSVVVDSVGLCAVVRSLIAGRDALDKHLQPSTWHYRDWAMRKILDGYFDGDRHRDEKNNRVRLGFCRNYALERDLRVLAARLGATLTLKLSSAKNQSGRSFPSFKGEWRWDRTGHRNERSRSEVISVGASKARQFWDVTVADHPNLFALASGVLTHNSKPNPMPESVTDRCTKSHEYIFMLTKNAQYYFDQDAILEPISANTHLRVSQATLEEQLGSEKVPGKTNGPMKAVVRGGKTAEHGTGVKNNDSFQSSCSVLPGRLRKTAPTGEGIKNNESMDASLVAPGRRTGNKERKPASARGVPIDTGGRTSGAVAGSVPWEGFERNKRSVWTVTTVPFGGEFCRACQSYYEGDGLRALRVETIDHGDRKEKRRHCRCGSWDKWLSHFATFPPTLIEPCIEASTSEYGCCVTCGSPWRRVIERGNPSKYAADPENTLGWANTHSKTSNPQSSASLHRNEGGVYRSAESKGWEPGCDCPVQTANGRLARGIVLDLFGGAGTTGMASDRLRRDAVLIEINPEYAEMARQRLALDAGPMFGDIQIIAPAREAAE